MDGRVAITSPLKPQTSSVEAFSSVDGTLASATAWSMNSIWVTPQEVIATPRQAMKSDDADDGVVLTRGQPMANAPTRTISVEFAWCHGWRSDDLQYVHGCVYVRRIARWRQGLHPTRSHSENSDDGDQILNGRYLSGCVAHNGIAD